MPGKMLSSASCAAIALIASCADSEAIASEEQLCYTRTYSAEHLKSHPNQQVVKISAYTTDRGVTHKAIDLPNNRGSFFNAPTITLVATIRATTNPLFREVKNYETSQLSFDCIVDSLDSTGSETLLCGIDLESPDTKYFFSASVGYDKFIYLESEIGDLTKNPLFGMSISGIQNKAYPGVSLDSSRIVRLGAEMFCDDQACADQYKPVSYVMSSADISACDAHAASARPDW